MRRSLLLIGLVLAVIGIAVVSLPFGHPEPQMNAAIGEYQSTLSRCSAPVISAWHRDATAGWFGYAPLTSTPMDAAFPNCKATARRRLAGGTLFVLCGIAVTVVALGRRDDEPTVPVDDAA